MSALRPLDPGSLAPSSVDEVIAPAAGGRPGIYHGWWIVAVAYLSQMVTVGASGWVLSVLIQPMERDLGWSRVQLVGVLTLSSVLAGAVSARLGPAVDRHGTRLLQTVSAIVGGSCLVLVALVTAPWQYYLCWAGLGLSIPGLMTLGPGVAIANWFVRKRALAFTLYTFGSATAGIVLAPTVAQIVERAGWRAGWLVLGVLLWCVAPLAWLAVRRRPEDLGLHPDGDITAVTGRQPGRSQPAVTYDEPAWTVREVLHTRSFWFVTAALMLTSLPASSIFVHMAPYIASKGFSVAAGATALSAYGIGVLPGRAVWGVLIRRLGIHRALIAFGFSYAAGIVLFLLPATLPGLYATAILLGLSIAGSQQLQMQVYPDYFGRRIVGALLGYAGISLTAARAVAPLFAAFMYDRTGSYTIAFGIFAVACLIAGATFLLAAPPRHAPRQGPAIMAG